MEALDKEGMANIMGGGWYYLPDGTKVYLPDDEGQYSVNSYVID